MRRLLISIVMIAFFVAVCGIIFWKYSRDASQYRLLNRSLSDQALSYFDDALKSLTDSQIEAQRESIELNRLEIAEQKSEISARISLIPFRTNMRKLSAIAYLSVGCLSVLIVASAGAMVLVKRGTVFHATVNGSVFPVRYSDLSNVLPALMGTVQASIQAALKTNDDDAHERARNILSDMSTMFKSLGGRRGIGSQTIDITPTPEAPALPASTSIPTFRDIISNLEEGDQMVLGFDRDTHEANTGTFERIFSCGFFGLSKSGKTTGLIGLVCQSLLAFPEISYVVIDPHRKRKEGLTSGLPKTEHFHHLDPDNFRQGLYAFNREFSKRLDQDEDFSTRPMVLLVDELPVVIKHKQGFSLEALVSRIAAEGRKVGVYCLISGQDTRLKGAGEARDLLCSSMAYRLSKKQARYLLDDDSLVSLHEQVRESKTPGLCLFNPTDDEASLIQQPYCTPQDVQWVEAQFTTKNEQKPVKNTTKNDSDISEQDETNIETETKQDVKQDATILQQEPKLSPVAKPVATDETQGTRRNAILSKVEAYMDEHKMSLSKFAELAAVNKGTLSQTLKGERELTNETAQKLLIFFQSQDQPHHAPVILPEAPGNYIN